MTAHEELLPRDEEADAERLASSQDPLALALHVVRLEAELDRHDDRVRRMREENSRLWERLRAADPARARTLADQLGHESEEAAAREELLS